MRKGSKHTEESKKKISKNMWHWTGKHLSKEHKKKLSIAKLGKKFSLSHKQNLSKARAWRIREHHPRWKGGFHNSGYVFIWTPKGMISKHRDVMKNYIGRELTSKEIVHHKNGIKTDNRLSNLKLMTNSEHMKLHYNPALAFKKGHKFYERK